MKTRTWLLVVLMVVAGQGLHAEEERFVDKAGRGIKKGADATAKGIEKGVDATGKGVNKGVEATGRFFKKADNWIGGKMSKKGGTNAPPPAPPSP